MTGTEKDEQERVVGDVLAKAYREVTGAPLLSCPPGASDPPDLLFEWKGVSVGVEVTELHQFQGQRALYEDVANKTQEIIAQSGRSHKYIGTVISLAHLADSSGRAPIEAEWRRLSIKRPIDRVCEELASAFLGQIKSADAVPDGPSGKMIHLDASHHPASFALFGSRIPVNRRGLPKDPTSVPWPMIVSLPGYTFDDQQMQAHVAKRLLDKTSNKRRNPDKWKAVGHAILAVHDLPRDRTIYSVSIPWSEWLRAALPTTQVLSEYDELWLVTYDNLHGRALRIGGNPPSPSHAQN